MLTTPAAKGEEQRAMLRALAERRPSRSAWRHAALLLSVSAAQTCLSVPWARAVSNPIAALDPLALGLFVLSGIVAAMLMGSRLDRLNVPGALRPIVPLVGLIVTLEIALTAVLYPGRPPGGVLADLAVRILRAESLVTPDIVMMALTIAAWWLGLSNARRWFDVAAMRRVLQAGIVTWLLFIIFNVIQSHESPTPFIAGYLFCMLMGLALARSEELASRRLVSRAPFGPAWFLASIAAALALVAAGALAWLVGVPAALAVFWGILGILIRLIFVVVVLFGIVVGLFQRVDPNVPAPETTIVPGREPFLGVGESLSAEQMTQVVQTVSTVVFGLLFVLIVVLLLRFSQRFRRAQHALGLRAVEEDRLRPGTAGAAGAGSDRLVRRWLNRLRGGPSRWLTELTIRRIYAQTTALGAACSVPRPTYATPYEYLPTLVRLFAGSENELRLITDAYVRAHYGQLPDTPERLNEVRDAFQRVRAEADTLLAYYREEDRKAQARLKDTLRSQAEQDRPTRLTT